MSGGVRYISRTTARPTNKLTKWLQHSVGKRSMVEWLDYVNADAFLVGVSGIMAVISGVSSYRSTHAQKYRLLVTGAEESDVVAWSCVFMALIGVINMVIAGSKSLRAYKLSFNKYVFAIIMALVGNFCVALVLTEHKNKIINGLEPAMMGQLKESALTRQRFGVGFSLSEAWDFMQIKMLCCGVESYKDYIQLTGGISANSPVPVSCCVMKPLSGDAPEPDNLSQCQHDAKLGVHDSIFLHVNGCHSPVSRWLIRHVNKTMAMLFGTICLQALGIFYLSWVGFRRNSKFNARY